MFSFAKYVSIYIVFLQYNKGKWGMQWITKLKT